MDWFNSHILSVIVFLPACLGLSLFLMPVNDQRGTKFVQWWSFLGSLAVFAISLILYRNFLPYGEEFQFTEWASWISTLGVSYHLGIDGISLWLILLTTALTPIVLLSSFSAITHQVRAYYAFVLLLESGMLGAFVALDTFLFYVFWEVMLIPMYFLVGIWGGKERIYAAMKFFIYTVAGSLLMLVAIFFLAYQHKIQFGTFSTDLLALYQLQLPGGGFWAPQSLMFIAFAIAFAIKVPLFPLHTWLPDAHVQAPTGGSVILAGVLLKMGGYGFIRFAFPLFPDGIAYYQNLFLVLGAIAIVYGAWVAMVQPDIKKLVAYSSVSHMGYVVLGLFSLNAIGANGSVYQMLNHGVSTGALFLLVGMIYERRHTRMIADFGGISKKMPLFTVIFMIATLSSIALPGTNGFVGEFLILLGTWQANPTIAIVAGFGVIFGAVYMLWMFQRVMFGPVNNPENEKLKDLNFREIAVMTPLVAAIFIMGIFPNYFLKPMEPSIARFLERSKSQVQTSVTKRPGFDVINSLVKVGN